MKIKEPDKDAEKNQGEANVEEIELKLSDESSDSGDADTPKADVKFQEPSLLQQSSLPN